MSSKSDYSPQEWEQLTEAVFLAPANMMLNLGKTNLIKALKETSALLNGLKKIAGDNYSQNELIQALAHDKTFASIDLTEVRTIHYQQAFEQIIKAAEIVDRVDSRSAGRAYRQFLLDLTEHVAQAAGEGFLGSGKKLSQAEIDYISELKDNLGV